MLKNEEPLISYLTGIEGTSNNIICHRENKLLVGRQVAWRPGAHKGPRAQPLHRLAPVRSGSAGSTALASATWGSPDLGLSPQLRTVKDQSLGYTAKATQQVEQFTRKFQATQVPT